MKNHLASIWKYCVKDPEQGLAEGLTFIIFGAMSHVVARLNPDDPVAARPSIIILLAAGTLLAIIGFLLFFRSISMLLEQIEPTSNEGPAEINPA